MKEKSNNKSIDATLKGIFSRIMNRPPKSIDDTTSQDTLSAWNSLNHLLLITEVEKDFDIAIPIDVSLEIKSFHRLKEVVSKRVRERRA